MTSATSKIPIVLQYAILQMENIHHEKENTKLIKIPVLFGGGLLFGLVEFASDTGR